MCPPGCLHSVCNQATRRGLLKQGFALAAGSAIAGASMFAAEPAKAASAPRTFSDVVDLTHPLFEGFPTFDGSKWFTKEPFLTYAKEKLNINKWTLMEHTGTHMDAPLHFSPDGMSVDLIPINDLIVPLAIIDISDRAQDNANSAVTPDDVKGWEAKNGPLPEGCCVAMNSGWGKMLMTPKFAGRDDAGKNHTPGFHGETAHMLMTERKVKGSASTRCHLTPASIQGRSRCTILGCRAGVGGLNASLISTPFRRKAHFSYLAAPR